MTDRHLPRQVPIDAYGHGGFRFGGMSHRGSLLCLPDGIWAWPVAAAATIRDADFEPVFARAGSLDLVVLGAGEQAWSAPPELRRRFRDLGLSFDVMTTGAAIRTYNVLVAEGRRVGAALIAV